MTTRLWCIGASAFCIFLAACTSDPTGGAVTIATEVDFSSEPVQGTFEVTAGSDVLGCSQGTFVDKPAGQVNLHKLLTCESGTRSGTFTVNIVAQHTPGPGDQNGPWSVVEATEDFTDLSGEGDFSVEIDEATESGVETLTGEIEYAT